VGIHLWYDGRSSLSTFEATFKLLIGFLFGLFLDLECGLLNSPLATVSFESSLAFQTQCFLFVARLEIFHPHFACLANRKFVRV
jgi:hypothetical protein